MYTFLLEISDKGKTDRNQETTDQLFEHEFTLFYKKTKAVIYISKKIKFMFF